MESVYFLCALVGGTVFLAQLVMMLLGAGLDADVDHDVDGVDDLHAGDAPGPMGEHGSELAHDHESSWFAGVLTFRTIIAALTFFGLTGMAAHTNGVAPVPTLAMATIAGATALYLVAWVMRSLYRLRDDGTVQIDLAVGRPATVYLTIPGQQGGRGKITLSLQERTVEYEAITSGDSLPTGTQVVVVGVIGPETVEVARSPVAQETAHA